MMFQRNSEYYPESIELISYLSGAWTNQLNNINMLMGQFCPLFGGWYEDKACELNQPNLVIVISFGSIYIYT